MRSDDVRRENLRISNEESNRITVEAITMALMLLLSEKSYDKITVTDIINKAGVSRSGFYRNFKSKEAVVNRVSDEIGDALFDGYAKASSEETTRDGFLAVFNYVKEHEGYYKMMLGADVPAYMILRLRGHVKEITKGTDGPTLYKQICTITATLIAAVEWFRGGMRESPEEMADIMTGIFNSAR